jgi:hypothetical protein
MRDLVAGILDGLADMHGHRVRCSLGQNCEERNMRRGVDTLRWTEERMEGPVHAAERDRLWKMLDEAQADRDAARNELLKVQGEVATNQRLRKQLVAARELVTRLQELMVK